MDDRVAMLLKEHSCSIATVTPEGKPQAAAILFAADSKLDFFFETSPEYRKARNLSENPNAAISIANEACSLQVEGIVSFLQGKEALNAKRLLAKKMPGIKKWVEKKGQLILRLTPSWVRLWDSGKKEFVQVI